MEKKLFLVSVEYETLRGAHNVIVPCNAYTHKEAFALSIARLSVIEKRLFRLLFVEIFDGLEVKFFDKGDLL